MNIMLSIPVSDLSALRAAVVLAKEHALYNEKRCLECASECSSEILAASFLRGKEIAHYEYLKYQRLLNLFDI